MHAQNRASLHLSFDPSLVAAASAAAVADRLHERALSASMHCSTTIRCFVARPLAPHCPECLLRRESPPCSSCLQPPKPLLSSLFIYLSVFASSSALSPRRPCPQISVRASSLRSSHLHTQVRTLRTLPFPIDFATDTSDNPLLLLVGAVFLDFAGPLSLFLGCGLGHAKTQRRVVVRQVAFLTAGRNVPPAMPWE
jgi:hypothetical protein